MNAANINLHIFPATNHRSLLLKAALTPVIKLKHKSHKFGMQFHFSLLTHASTDMQECPSTNIYYLFVFNCYCAKHDGLFVFLGLFGQSFVMNMV